MKFVFAPIGLKLRIKGWVAENIASPQETLSFILQDKESLYPEFFWPAYCWPFKVRKKKVDAFVNTGRLPNHMDHVNEYGAVYNLIMDGKYCKHDKYVFIDSTHGRGFMYYPIGEPNAIRRYIMHEKDLETNLNILFNSYIGSIRPRHNFQLEAIWYTLNGVVHQIESSRHIEHADQLIGVNVQDKVLISVPFASFQKF